MTKMPTIITSIIIIDVIGSNKLMSTHKTVPRPTSPTATPDDGQGLTSRAKSPESPIQTRSGRIVKKPDRYQ